MVKTIAERWEEVNDTLESNGIHSIVIKHCRRAFYVGVQQTLYAAIDISNLPISEDEGAAMVQSMMNECDQFCLDMVAGKV